MSTQKPPKNEFTADELRKKVLADKGDGLTAKPEKIKKTLDEKHEKVRQKAVHKHFHDEKHHLHHIPEFFVHFGEMIHHMITDLLSMF